MSACRRRPQISERRNGFVTAPSVGERDGGVLTVSELQEARIPVRPSVRPAHMVLVAVAYPGTGICASDRKGIRLSPLEAQGNITDSYFCYIYL